MTAITSAAGAQTRPAADRALAGVAALWWGVALIGQWLFVAYVAAFYGGAAVAGDFERWNEVLVGGYVRGGTLGNVVLAAHLALAVVITLGGPLQLVPQIRARALPFHRWNGRLYILIALIISLGGLYMVWTRGTAGGTAMRVGISLNGVLIVAAGALAWRYVRAGDIAAHRCWALRTFMLVSGVWFFRVGLMAWILANRGPALIGEDFDGPFVRFWAFGCYLVPLAMLEIYLRAGAGTGRSVKFAAAALLLAVTAVAGVGILGAVMGMWLPRFS